jgi:membrane protein implicated in regulation of membrane protease activity
MPWYCWIVVGALLLAAELFVIPADFFLVFLGLSAIAVGALAWLELGIGASAQWALFAALAAAALVAFRRRLSARAASTVPTRVDDTLVGERGVASEALPAGAAGRVELRGVPWSARNAGSTDLAAGAAVRVQRVDGLTLFVVAD